jgi:O-succinylbenzoic acid--CoA ligase
MRTMPTATGPALRAKDTGAGSLREWTAGIAAALDGSGPALLPLPDGPQALRRELVAALRPDDPQAPLEAPGVALVAPTSGSTGVPKGALLPAAAVRASASATAQRLQGPGRWVLALPLTHVAGLMVVARAVLAGTEPVPVASAAGFEPARFAEATADAASRCARDGRPLYVSLVPTQLDRLLSAGVDLRGYDAVLLGAAAAPAALLDRAQAAGVRVVTTYGMSETCGGCVYDGRPLAGVDVAIEEGGAGRVLLGGPTLFAGYRLRPDLTAAALDPQGRLRTGDLGRLDGARLEVLGRLDDVIVSGGENVVPGRVEAVLAGLVGLAGLDGLDGRAGAVRGWAVIGVPDAVWGQRVVALVEAAPDAELPGLDTLRAAAARELPAAWLPRDLVRVDTLPMLATGKVDRDAARALAEAEGAAP